MPPKVCVNKLKREMKDFVSSPPPHIPAIHVNERNLLEWHFLIEGPPDTPYAGGVYIGKLRFPPEYPFRPPSIFMLTPNARFETGTRLCLSMSDFHPETWSPLWSVASVLTGLLSFMCDSEITTGSLESTRRGGMQDAEKAALARGSLAWNLRQPQLAAMFLQLHERRAAAEAAAPRAPGLEEPSADAGRPAGAEARVAEADLEPVLIAEARLVEGDPAAAVACIDRALRRHKGGRPPAVLLMAKAAALARAGDMDTAAALAQEAQTWVGFRAAGPGRRAAGGGVDLAALDPADCQRRWRAAAQAKEEGNAAYRQGEHGAARAAYQRALEQEPACATVLCNLAAAFAQLGCHEEAAAAASRSLAVSAAYGKARRRLADSLAACGRNGEAAALYVELLEASPGDPTLQSALGACRPCVS